MFRILDGHLVYVVTLDQMPELPVTGEGREKAYAEALTAAITQGTISEPGTYAIEVFLAGGLFMQWQAFRVEDPEKFEASSQEA